MMCYAPVNTCGPFCVSLLQVFGDSDEEDLPETQVVGGAQTEERVSLEERVSCSYMSAVPSQLESPKICVCRVYCP